MRKGWLLLVSALISLTTMAQEKYLLRFNPTVGDKLELKADMKMNMTIEAMPVSMTLQMGMQKQCLAVTDTMRTIETTFNNATGNARMGEMTQDLTPMLGEKLNNMKIRQSVDAMYRLKSIDNEMINNKLEEIGFNPKDLMSQMVFPQHPVAVGESWESEVKINDNHVTGRFTLLEMTDKEFVVEIKAQLDVTTEAEGKKVSTRGIINGRTAFDRRSGWEIPGKITSKSQLNIGAEGQSIKMEIVANM